MVNPNDNVKSSYPSTDSHCLTESQVVHIQSASQIDEPKPGSCQEDQTFFVQEAIRATVSVFLGTSK